MYSRSAAISSALTSAAAEAVFDPIRRTSWQPSGTIVVTGTQDRQDLGCNSAVAGELVKSVLHHVVALAADFKKHGAAAIEKVRKTQPAAYMKICALLVPREMQVEHTNRIKQ